MNVLAERTSVKEAVTECVSKLKASEDQTLSGELYLEMLNHRVGKFFSCVPERTQEVQLPVNVLKSPIHLEMPRDTRVTLTWCLPCN